ncbi:MAG: Gfo/Idh/MocA family oxidoreductase, partial [Clostridia bacterium]|nr:Gfo/Idh/MocA family oxidoreductase [Clostridia bacterium]
CAPDTFLGAGIQTCMRLISEGAIGRPVAGSAFMMCHGHESWHPAPEFYYDVGGGPLFDMGPYYITALVRLLGPAESVVAYGGRAYEERTITSEPKKGTKIPVRVDTHNAGVIRFRNGATVTLVTSFDVWKHSMPKIEIYGTEGTLSVPDPNTFGGPVRLSTVENKDFTEIPVDGPYFENSRGLGLSETVLACAEGRMNNASGRLALHVLEIMEAFVRSGESGARIVLESTPSDPVAMDWSTPKGTLKTK